MKIKINFRLNQILFLLIIISFFAVSFALTLEYFFSIKPCNLCFYERKPFFAIIAMAILVMVFFKSKKAKKNAIIASIIFLIVNAGISFYHAGVERKIFKISESCVSKIEDNLSLEQLKMRLLEEPLARCDEPQFFLFSFSLAEINFIYCLSIALLAIFLYRKSKK